MRYAVILGSTVENIIVAEPGFKIPGRKLVASEDAGPGWTYESGQFSPPAVSVPVPQSITPLQARRALREAGLIDQVNAAVEAAGPDARDAWEYAIEVRRDNAMLAGLAAQLGMTEAQLDALFVRAATL